MLLPVYKRTIEGWRLEGNDAWVMPAPEQSDAWDALTIAEQDRITEKFALAIADEVMHDDLSVFPGERACNTGSKQVRDPGGGGANR